MPKTTSDFRCQDCEAPARNVVDGRRLCDACANRRLAAVTGWPDLPAPPAGETLVGADGRRHRFTYRLLRGPAGVEADAEEDGVPFGEGYEVSVLGAHDADAFSLVEALKERVRQEVGRVYLERSRSHPGWQVVGHELAGRVEEDPADWSGPPVLVVDGRPLSWDQAGELISTYVGWRFRLTFADPTDPFDIGDVGGLSERDRVNGRGQAAAVGDRANAVLGSDDDDDVDDVDESVLIATFSIPQGAPPGTRVLNTDHFPKAPR